MDSERRSGNKCGTAWMPQETDVTTDSERTQGLQKRWERAGLVLSGGCPVRACGSWDGGEDARQTGHLEGESSYGEEHIIVHAGHDIVPACSVQEQEILLE